MGAGKSRILHDGKNQIIVFTVQCPDDAGPVMGGLLLQMVNDGQPVPLQGFPPDPTGQQSHIVPRRTQHMGQVAADDTSAINQYLHAIPPIQF